ncbi:MAG: Gfo/Idh/MocA family oxidoreductase [Chloroflexi bacterium]|nr:Gfo/Idh/MocA family oxidoreductase [Chloroflexota bacterium]
MSRASPPPLRVAVVGAGAVARLRHLPAFCLAQQQGLARLVAVCDPVERAALAVAEEFAVPNCCFDYREVVARDDIDVVSVATPNAYHEEIAIAALEAGQHVMCEKPLALTYAGARRMAESARRLGRQTSVNFRYRWIPSARFLAELVRSGEIGDVYHIYLNYFNSALQDPNTPIRWRQQRAESGSGILGDLGSHMIDLAHLLVGPVRRVSAHLTTFTRERPVVGGGRAPVDVDDAATCVVEFASGATGVINASGCALGRANHQRVELYGTRGAAIYEIEKWDRGGDALQVCFSASQGRLAGFAPAAVPPEHTASTPLHPFLDFLRAIAAGRDPAVTFEDGARAQEVIEAAEQSARGGGSVNLPLLSAG